MANIKQPFGPETLPGISKQAPGLLCIDCTIPIFIIHCTICLLIGKEPTAYFGN